jgi:hypothetical protein
MPDFPGYSDTHCETVIFAWPYLSPEIFSKIEVRRPS